MPLRVLLWLSLLTLLAKEDFIVVLEDDMVFMVVAEVRGKLKRKLIFPGQEMDYVTLRPYLF